MRIALLHHDLQASFPGLGIRHAGEGDMPFLRRLYADTRAAELASSGWHPAQQTAFLAMQFEAQHRAYHAYPDTVYGIVTLDEEPIGRLYLQHTSTAIRIVDVSLLTQVRGGGIGTAILKTVLATGARAGQCVMLQVARDNRARMLYKRLGFGSQDDSDATISMAFLPPHH